MTSREELEALAVEIEENTDSGGILLNEAESATVVAALHALAQSPRFWKMKMSELILAIGDENVVFQNLDTDAHAIDKTRHGTKISFYTDAIQAEELLDGGQPKKMGLVLWFPRNKVAEEIAKAKHQRVK
jgi:hypothetical protein